LCSLGPNGGIVTSLNLFASRFDQVLHILDKRKTSVDYVFIDTPGQVCIVLGCYIISFVCADLRVSDRNFHVECEWHNYF
jgi:hypothetical protein